MACKKGVTMRRFTADEIAFLLSCVVGRNRYDAAAMFNRRFSPAITPEKIVSFRKNRKIHSGIDGRFLPGSTPWNAGKKGVNMGESHTRYKKGNRPNTWRPVGSERVGKDGYVEIKVAEKKWMSKHRAIWEKENGPVPHGCIVIFADKNIRNFNVRNLISVSREELLRMNQEGLIFENAEATKSGAALAKVITVVNRLEKKTARSRT